MGLRRAAVSRRACAAVAAAALGATTDAATAAVAEPAPFGHPCAPQGGVRVCPTTAPGARVPSWDGTPIDVDVTLPAAGAGPWPTILLLHPLGAGKTAFASADPTAAAGLNATALALRGYAVVTPTARGHGGSCGLPAWRTPDCAQGWTHLNDQRYEVRDYQTLLGLLADQGIARPSRLGVAGLSYGAAAATMLAYLRDRIRLPTGAYAPWLSPKGTPLAIGVAYARWPWSDLAGVLAPNGRGPWSSTPFGVVAGSLTPSIADPAAAGVLVAPAGTGDASADIAGWRAALAASRDTVAARRALTELRSYHGVSATTGRAAPLVLESGWTDALLPVSQAVAVYEQQRRLDPRAPVTLLIGDVGHPRAANRAADTQALVAAGLAALDAHLRDVGAAPSAGRVTASIQTCPATTPSGGPPLEAASWSALARGRLTIGASHRFTVTSAGGDPGLAARLDPASTDACATYPVAVSAHTAVLRRLSPGVTLLGAPVLRATAVTASAHAQLTARLWDVDAAGRTQVLVASGSFRPTAGGLGRATPVAWTLEGNGYRFARGRTIRLEIVGRSAPATLAAPGRFSVSLRGVSVSLPTRDGPSRSKGIAAPR